MSTLYVALFDKLEDGQRLAQLAHVVAKACVLDPETARLWVVEKGSVVVVVATPGDLRYLIAYGAEHFVEPDLGNAITAVAQFDPTGDARRIFQKLPLAGV